MKQPETDPAEHRDTDTGPDTDPNAGSTDDDSQEDSRPLLWPRAVVLLVLVGGVLFALSLGLEPLPDRGVRVWLLNHTPDQVLVMDPDVMGFKGSFGVADGLQEITFSEQGDKAYIASVVDVVNRISIIDANNFQKIDDIVTSGIPQGVAAMRGNDRKRRVTMEVEQDDGTVEEDEVLVPPYPGDRYLAYIPGSRTKFEAAGFTVLDLEQQAPDAANRYRMVCRIRENELDLLNNIESSPDGRYIYAVAAKSANIYVYDFWRCMNQLPPDPERINIDQSIFGLHIPDNGPYIYASAINTKMIYVIDRETNEIVRYLRHPDDFLGRFRNMTTGPDGTTLYATVRERSELLQIDATTGEVLETVQMPVRTDLIEMSPYYDELYLVGNDEGRIYRVKLPSFEISEPLEPRGDFRDIAVRPIPDERMLTADQLERLRGREG